MTEPLNQAIDAKAVDLPSHEIADPWLSHSEELRNGGLGDSFSAWALPVLAMSVRSV
jgi:hypothetical protein